MGLKKLRDAVSWDALKILGRCSSLLPPLKSPLKAYEYEGRSQRFALFDRGKRGSRLRKHGHTRRSGIRRGECKSDERGDLALSKCEVASEQLWVVAALAKGLDQ